MEVNFLMCNIITSTKGSANCDILNYERGGDKFLRRVDKVRDLSIAMSSFLSPWAQYIEVT